MRIFFSFLQEYGLWVLGVNSSFEFKEHELTVPLGKKEREILALRLATAEAEDHPWM